MSSQAALPLLALFSGALAALVCVPGWRSAVERAGFSQPERDLDELDRDERGPVATGAGISLLVVVALAPLVLLAADTALPERSLITLELTQLYRLGLVVYGGLALAMLGAVDDLTKLVERDTAGFLARYKILLQFVLGAAVTYPLIEGTPMLLPGGAELGWPFGLRWALSVVLVVGAVNGANFTDGIDSLLAAVSLPAFLVLALLIPATPGAYLMLFFAGLLVGFGVYNFPPASVFMGDSGAYLAGALLALAAAAHGLQLALFLLALVWGVEVLSVMLQVAAYRLFNKRILRMSPLHHHFELAGWPEKTIVAAFTAVSALACLGAAELWGGVLS